MSKLSNIARVLSSPVHAVDRMGQGLSKNRSDFVAAAGFLIRDASGLLCKAIGRLVPSNSSADAQQKLER